MAIEVVHTGVQNRVRRDRNAVEGKSTDYASSQAAVRSRECLASRLAREVGSRFNWGSEGRSEG